MAKDQMDRAKKAYAEARPTRTWRLRAVELQAAAMPSRRRRRRRNRKTFSRWLHRGEEDQFAVTVADGKAAEREIDKLNVEKAEMNAGNRPGSGAGQAGSRKAMSERSGPGWRQRPRRRRRQAKANRQLMKELANLKAKQTERGSS